MRSNHRGSITLYLCLSLSVLLSLLSASIYSARMTAGRVMVASSLEQGLYSLFGEYDQKLFEKYGLLFIDGGRGSSSLRLHTLTGAVEEYASYILDPGKGMIGGNAPVSLGTPSASMTAYSLATDGNRAALIRQICTAAKAVSAANGIGKLKEIVTETDESPGLLPVQQSGDTSVPGVTEDELKAAEEIEISTDYRDPRELVEQAKSMGIFQLLLPGGSSVSGSTASLETFPSRRALQRGIGVSGQETGFADRALLQAYATQVFTCYTDHPSGTGLQYQLEYLIGGKESDAENLKNVMLRLLGIREVANLTYLNKDKVKRKEALAIALVLSVLAPGAAEEIAVGVRAAWAFAEAVIDVRSLLAGGKVPLVKDDASWQLSLEKLPGFLLHAGTGQPSAQKGQTYEQYLNGMLLLKNSGTLADGMMDLIEDSMRTDLDEPEFRIDNCIDAVTIELSAPVEGRQYTIAGRYGYGTA